MRKPKYMSPTSLKLFYQDREQYYLQYLAETKVSRQPQTEPMAVGSAFDAYVKSWLVEKLIGRLPEFAFEAIFEAQVDTQNRDVARADGKLVFDAYVKQGALADVLLDLESCIGKPKFETTVEGYVSSASVIIGDVPFLGKPDIYFITRSGARIIFDWKVNGFYSQYNVSPKPGYVRIRTADRENGRQHPRAFVTPHQGVRVSAKHPLCEVDKEWAAQLCIYAWLLGEEVGGKFVVAIDQIACGRDDFGGRAFRIAQHRSLVTDAFQYALFERANRAWYAIQSGHIFFEVSREASDAKCGTLEQIAQMPPDPSFDEIIR